VAARISTIALVVPDYDAAIDFYVGALGFQLTEDVDQGRKRWVTVQPPGGGPRLLLARADGPVQETVIGNQAGGRVFLFLQTDDFARDHAAMCAAGVTFEEPPRHEPYGTVAVWRDPFGNRWDLLGPAQGALVPAGKALHHITKG
jgi:catechol 2,3-dioxygenase-like lactoylglutathione lyase family enzyme